MRRPTLLILILLPFSLPALGRGGPERPPEPEWSDEKRETLLALAAEFNPLVEKPGSADEKDRVLEKAADLGAIPAREVKDLVKELFEVARSGPRSDGRSECTAKYEPFPGTYYLSGAGNGRGIFVGLHGGGAGVGDGRTAQGQWGGATGKGLIGVFPTANLPGRKTTFYSPEVERFVLSVLRELKRTYRIDTNRIYVAGHSLGGSGAWHIGLRNADIFAAVSPNAGGCHGTPSSDPGMNILPGGYVANLFNTPIFFTHYDEDPQVDVRDSRAAAKELAELSEEHPDGYEHVYIEGEGVNHGFPPGGSPGKIISWMTRHERDPYPEKVVWEPNVVGKHLFFWLRKRPVFDSTSRTTRIVAVRDGHRIEIEGKQLHGLSVLLSDEMYDGRKPLEIVVNGEVKYEGYPPVDPRALLESILERIDPEQVFLRRVDI